MVKVSKKWPRRIIPDFWRDAWAISRRKRKRLRDFSEGYNNVTSGA